MEVLISVIIPVYNVKKYLKKCVYSIISQTYKNLEILLIDDGSSDGSEEICDKLYEIDNRIKVIHKENGGQSEARNYGLDIAKGNYYIFVDSDDWLDPIAIEKMYHALVSENSEIVCCGIYITDGVNKKICWKQNKEIYTYNNEDSLKKMLQSDGTSSNVCARLYNKRLFDNIRFPINRTFEDAATSYRLFMKSKKTTFLSNSYYYYFKRPGSTMGRRDIFIRFDELQAGMERYCNIKEKYKKEIAEMAFANLMYDYIHVLECFIRDKHDVFQLEKEYIFIKGERIKYKYNVLQYLDIRKKIESTILLISKDFFIYFIKIVNKFQIFIKKEKT